MKTPPASLPRSGFLRVLCLCALLPLGMLGAAEDKIIAAVRAADDERQAATIAGDAKRLDAIFSDALHYAHSSGVIDTKASYVKSLVSKTSVYQGFDYKERTFIPVAPGVVLMKGHAIIKAGSNGQINLNDVNYLAVWREEAGKWRFVAWQASRNSPPVEVKK